MKFQVISFSELYRDNTLPLNPVFPILKYCSLPSKSFRLSPLTEEFEKEAMEMRVWFFFFMARK